MKALPMFQPCAAILLFGCLAVTGCTTPEGENALARADRECRTTKALGTRMRQSVCLSKDEWAYIDAQETERLASEAATDDYLRRIEDYNLQHPVSPGDTYNPYPGY